MKHSVDLLKLGIHLVSRRLSELYSESSQKSFISFKCFVCNGAARQYRANEVKVQIPHSAQLLDFVIRNLSREHAKGRDGLTLEARCSDRPGLQIETAGDKKINKTKQTKIRPLKTGSWKLECCQSTFPTRSPWNAREKEFRSAGVRLKVWMYARLLSSFFAHHIARGWLKDL